MHKDEISVLKKRKAKLAAENAKLRAFIKKLKLRKQRKVVQDGESNA